MSNVRKKQIMPLAHLLILSIEPVFFYSNFNAFPDKKEQAKKKTINLTN